MTIANITITQDPISNEDNGISCTVDGVRTGLGINDSHHRDWHTVMVAILDVGASVCESQEIYDALHIIATQKDSDGEILRPASPD
jgi:hypothetical protein